MRQEGYVEGRRRAKRSSLLRTTSTVAKLNRADFRYQGQESGPVARTSRCFTCTIGPWPDLVGTTIKVLAKFGCTYNKVPTTTYLYPSIIRESQGSSFLHAPEP
jgi:hypothetical protein